MNAFEALAACAGSWRGTSTLQDPNTGKPEDSASTLTVTPILDGKFVRVDYTWSDQGKPQSGSLLVGCEPEARAVSVHWIDTWHMSRKVMALSGALPGVADGGLPVETPSLDSGDTLSVRGAYAAPPGPDWGWRIDITPDPGPALRIVMFNIWPDGQREELAVDATYHRSQPRARRAPAAREHPPRARMSIPASRGRLRPAGARRSGRPAARLIAATAPKERTRWRLSRSSRWRWPRARCVRRRWSSRW